MSGRDILIIIAVLACMAVMGYLRTRKLVRETEEVKHDSESGGKTDK